MLARTRRQPISRYLSSLILTVLLTVINPVLHAQMRDDLIFRAGFDADDPIAPVFRFVPNQPFNVIFQCQLRTVQTNQESPLNYFFDFHDTGSLILVIPLDQGSIIRMLGNYTYENNEIAFSATGSYELTGVPIPLSFSLTSTLITPRLGLVGYFTAAGERRDGSQLAGQPVAITMRCATIGHRNNPEGGVSKLRLPRPKNPRRHLQQRVRV